MIGQTISHYRIVAKVGSGGMGVVYQAADLKLDRFVALKFLPEQFAHEGVAKRRFVQEAQAASRLDHPHIAMVHEIAETETGWLYIVMPFYEGETLKQKIARGPVPIMDAVEWALQVASGLEAAHSAGIVHRDLKPANVMITDQGRAKILDFGVAKVAGIELTASSTTLGTAAYMSPEQARGDDVDEQTDIWSLGVVLYEMLAGEAPFRAEYEQALVYKILNEDPDPVTFHNADVRRALADTVHRALAKDREERFRDMAGFHHALRQAREPDGDPKSSETSPSRPSIAVLPFSDMSPGRDHDYFCEGVAEELITALTRIGGLRVASRTSSFLFQNASDDIREIGKKLDVGSVLEGSVRKANNRLRVTVQLVDATTGYHLWSERYDRELVDIFAIQDEIAENTVRALRGVLTEADKNAIKKGPSAEIEAYDYYLRGRQFLHQLRRRSVEHARGLFNRAIEIDPGYAPAHAALAFCSYFRYQWFGQEETDRHEADRASRRAVELAPDLGESHVARGLALAAAEQFDEAEQAMENALRVNPNLYDANYFYGRICFMQGKFGRAAELFERAAELDPLEYQSSSLLSCVYEALGQEEAAHTQWRTGFRRAERHLELNPDDVRAIDLASIALIQMGEKAQGLAWQRRALAMEPEDPVVVWNAACAHSLAGEYDEALNYLEKAITLGISNRRWVEHDPDMDPLRSHPRFQALLQTMK